MNRIVPAALALVTLGAVVALWRPPPTAPAAASTPAPIEARPLADAGGYAHHGAAKLPDPRLTPGAVMPGITRERICAPGYATSVRSVSASTKRAVYEEYRVAYPPPSGSYEVDHLISLELGGSNDVTNLWPQPYAPAPGAHEKDRLEDIAHRRICSGQLDLAVVQQRIALDWYALYLELVGGD